MRNAGFFNREKCDAERNGRWNVWTVILFICALPVLIPLACMLCAVLLGAVFALAGGALAVVVGVAGGALAIVAAAAGCMVAAAIGLAALLFGSLMGIGFGIVILFSAPASGLAILGMSLMMAGAGALGCLLFRQICVFAIWAVRKLAGWMNGRVFQKKDKRSKRTVQPVVEAAKKEGGQDA